MSTLRSRRQALAVPTIRLPTMHAGQIAAYKATTRFQALRCGRRWGKTVHGEIISCDWATKGWPVGIFAPDYKILNETYQEILDIVRPIKRSASKQSWVIRTTTGGRFDFWSLDNERAGRSRKYKFVWIDEGAYTKPNAKGIWEKSIRPTLLDLAGSALVTSNTNGKDPENFFWQICNDETLGFKEYHAPTHTNPFLPQDELAKLQRENHPLVYAQEYLAEFVDWSGVQFFAQDKFLVQGEAPPIPNRGVSGVYAVIDSAVKAGKEHDGTGVSYWATCKHTGLPLLLLDWDIVQIEGASLENWLPSVFKRLEELARQTNAVHGVLGAWIEDKASGTILLQQAFKRGWKAHAIDSGLTAVGKDERAINISGYVHREMVKFSKPAMDKVVVYKGSSRNHFLTQVLNFRVGDKLAATRADDLLDTFTYAVAIGLGNSEGF